MSTQFFGTDIPALLSSDDKIRDQTPDQTLDEISDANPDLHHQDGSAFRGLFFAMLFNLFLLLAIAAGLELWRITR